MHRIEALEECYKLIIKHEDNALESWKLSGDGTHLECEWRGRYYALLELRSELAQIIAAAKDKYYKE